MSSFTDRMANYATKYAMKRGMNTAKKQFGALASTSTSNPPGGSFLNRAKGFAGNAFSKLQGSTQSAPGGQPSGAAGFFGSLKNAATKKASNYFSKVTASAAPAAPAAPATNPFATASAPAGAGAAGGRHTRRHKRKHSRKHKRSHKHKRHSRRN